MNISISEVTPSELSECLDVIHIRTGTKEFDYLPFTSGYLERSV